MSASQPSKEPPADLDCKEGLHCKNYECERRHWDEMEQALQKTKKSNNSDQTNVIITASPDMGRTASTWVFNAVRLLYRQAGEACDSYFIRCLRPEKLRHRLESPEASPHVLIKTHEITENVQVFEREVLPFVTHVIVSVREGFPRDELWSKYARFVTKFDEIVNQPIKVLRELATYLGITDLSSLTDRDLRQVDYQLMTLPIPGNQASKFWSFHSRRGGRSPPPAPSLQSPSSNQKNDVLITRHGARIDNGPDRDGNWLKRAGHDRPQDAPLSPAGRQAASELGRELVRRQREEGLVVAHIVSSPLLRCVETADIVAEELYFNGGIQIEPGIAEVGTRPSHMATQQELEEQFPRIDFHYAPVLRRSHLPQKEWSDSSAAQRARRAGLEVRRRLEGTILFVGHGASCLGLVEAFGSGGYVGYCSLSHFHQTIGGVWQPVGQLGCVSHLNDQATALDSAW